jgi:hypothetical protein
LKLNISYGQHFVYQQYFRLEMRRYSEGEPHIHAARVMLARSIEESLDASKRDDLVESTADFMPTHPKNGAIQKDILASG